MKIGEDRQKRIYKNPLLLIHYNNIEKINNTNLTIDKNNNLTFNNNLKTKKLCKLIY